MLIKNWKDFARATIVTKDLDPTYDFLYAARLEKGDDWATRFAMNYLCFYDMGGAVAAAEQTTDESFWDYTIYNFQGFPRGTERRHSRGEVGLRYVHNLAALGTPSQIWEKMYDERYTNLVKLFQNNFKGCGFGPYFVWKVMDFQDRIFGRPVVINKAEVVKYCPDEPRKCAQILWPKHTFSTIMDVVVDYAQQFLAPGIPNRYCSYPEAETILCMLKGWGITKTHVIGDDIDVKYEQLKKWPEFLKFLPPMVEKDRYVRPATLDSQTLSAFGTGMVNS